MQFQDLNHDEHEPLEVRVHPRGPERLSFQLFIGPSVHIELRERVNIV